MVRGVNRHDDILHCVVESYIETAAPVGSCVVSRQYPEHLSPATIRNVMADLEEMGLIYQPHTSAGRVPTDKGYRYYVDSLIDWDDLEEIWLPDVRSALMDVHDVEDAAERMSRLIADVTKNAGVLYLKNLSRVSYFSDLGRRNVDADSERQRRANDRLYIDGTSNIFEQPEFRDAARIRRLSKELESKDSLAAFLEKDLSDRQVHIHIGGEVDCGSLEGVSMVVKEYSVEGLPLGCLGVIGPTRMKYDYAVGIVNKMAEAMAEFLGEL